MQRQIREGSWEEKRRGSQPPPAAPAPHSETCHSAGDGLFSVHAWGINLYQKGPMSEPLEQWQESEIKVWIWVYSWNCGQSHWHHKRKMDKYAFKMKIPAKSLYVLCQHEIFYIQCTYNVSCSLLPRIQKKQTEYLRNDPVKWFTIKRNYCRHNVASVFFSPH